jgi:hypothetical protein
MATATLPRLGSRVRIPLPAPGFQGFAKSRDFGINTQLVGGDINQAGAAEAEIGTDLAIEGAPHLQAALDQRNLPRIAILLAAPAPVSAGLLAGNHALFQQGNAVALTRQHIGGGSTDDATANDDDIRRRRSEASLGTISTGGDMVCRSLGLQVLGNEAMDVVMRPGARSDRRGVATDFEGASMSLWTLSRWTGAILVVTLLSGRDPSKNDSSRSDKYPL